jgi:hypothetical protein
VPISVGPGPDAGTVIDAGAFPDVALDRAAGVDAPGGCATTNFALGATASAQSTYSGYSPDRAIDGDNSTALGPASSWANNYSNPTIVLPQWFEIDFGVDRSFTRVDVYTTASYPIKDYDLSYWDGAAWAPILSMRGNTQPHIVHQFAEITSSRIRILGLSGPDIQAGYARLNEVEVCQE